LEPGAAQAGRVPVDFGGLVADLRSLGVRRGQDLLVHCSMRRVGPVDGGAATLLAAIQDVAGPAATIVVPAQTAWTSPTSREFRAATTGLDQDGVARYLAARPGFDPASTPSSGMGAFAEYVRTCPGAQRSAHPQSSFAALGPGAAGCTAGHDPDCHLGERSPLRWLYDADAAILLLGVDYTVCMAFHLAEYRISREAPVRGADLDDSDFAQLGTALDLSWRNGAARLCAGPDAAPRRGLVGTGASRRLPVRTAVDFAVGWLAKHRNWVAHDK
jgi:aminoglycoside 3-N-acetyltransferase